jgi:hypothetical protein
MPGPDQVFKDLRNLTQELNAWLEHNPPLTVMDQLLLENGIQMLQMIYTAWKARNAQRAVGE